MQKTTRLAAALVTVGLTLALPTGCSDDDGCDGQAYHPDLSQDGGDTPIRGLENWLGGHPGLPTPPDENWIVVQTDEKDPQTVVIKNDDGDGWWVQVARTDRGGWVVSAATDDSAGCKDQLDELGS